MVRIFGKKSVTDEDVMRALEQVVDPRTGKDIVHLGIIQGVSVRDGRVAISIEVSREQAPNMEPVRKSCEDTVRALPGVVAATAILTAELAPSRTPAGAGRELPRQQPPRAQPEPASRPGPPPLGEVRAVVAVASGKGGVGKSTVAVNLALGLQALGKKVGILDADIYGPSLPRMLAVSGKPETADGKTILPMEKHGLMCMSIGFMVPEDTATIWRGPMASSALQQMLTGVAWGALDVLIVDLPPGTGDIQLTMAQRAPITGSVIVSTPQDIALVDARKGLAMFTRIDVPVFGFIENMSYFACPSCGERTDIFSHGGAREAAEQAGTAFLGEIPLHIAIRETSDAGIPIVASNPDSAEAAAFMAIARTVAEKIEIALEADAKPRMQAE
ncbi:MAG: P-loop NTPase [Sphingomonadales bacterium]